MTYTKIVEALEEQFLQPLDIGRYDNDKSRYITDEEYIKLASLRTARDISIIKKSVLFFVGLFSASIAITLITFLVMLLQ